MTEDDKGGAETEDERTEAETEDDWPEGVTEDHRPEAVTDTNEVTARPKTSLLQRGFFLVITVLCFVLIYNRVNGAAQREGLSLVDYMSGVFATVDWLPWLALMMAYSFVYFAIDTLVVTRALSWFIQEIRYRDILPIRASAYIISIFNEQIGKGAMAYYLNKRDQVPGWEVGSVMLFVMFCEIDAATVVLGSVQLIPVRATVLDGGQRVSGVTVVFSTTLGDVSQDVVVTGADGQATTFFLAPAVGPGTAVVTARVASGPPSQQVATTCSILVTGATSPELRLSILSPDELAGLSITVVYDADAISLAPNGVLAVGGLAGSDCFEVINDDGVGTVRLVLGCPVERLVGGTEVARFTFINDSAGAPQLAGDFTITCVGADESGDVPAACTTTILQL